MLDESIPASVARMLVANGHQAEFIRDHAPPGSADPVVATVSQDIGALLISFDGDFQRLAARIPEGQRRRFRRLSRAEDARLRTAERLVNFIAVFCILSWRVFWMTMINRSVPSADPGIALTEVEIRILDQLVPDKGGRQPHDRTLSSYLVKIARLGGYRARNSDPPPGNTVMWRGLSRLADLRLGADLDVGLVGN